MKPSVTSSKSIIQKDAWSDLKKFTRARIALGNVGGSLPLKEVLDFKLSHAMAKDAIYSELNIDAISQQLNVFNKPVFKLKSRVMDRAQYLKRPDLGRRLHKQSADILAHTSEEFDIVFVLSDGLSAAAVNHHAFNLLRQIIPSVQQQYKIAFVFVEQGRVAIGDEIGELLHAKFTAVLVGERPGLSSPESMGVYTTYSPQVGLTDERRNCISNIHLDGLNYSDASRILKFLIFESFQQKISGVNIKIEIGKLPEAEMVMVG